jgi:hypothetical protein
MESRHFRALRNELADRPEATNAIVKALRQVYAYATEAELVDRNPAREVSYIKCGSQGFHSWTIEEIQQFEERHPVGTKARWQWPCYFNRSTPVRSDPIRPRWWCQGRDTMRLRDCPKLVGMPLQPKRRRQTVAPQMCCP